MSKPKSNIWNNFNSYVNNLCSNSPEQKHNCSIIKNLNPGDPSKEIYICVFCNNNIINTFMKSVGKDTIYFDPSSRFFMAYIPSSSKYLVETFCCNITMQNIHNKFANFGLAIQGNYDINAISGSGFVSGFGSGSESGSGSQYKNNSEINFKTNKSYLVINNHKTVKIIPEKELNNYYPHGINIQCIEGWRIYDKGEPFISFSDIKEFTTDNSKPSDYPSSNPIDYSQVIIDYDKLKIFTNKINNSKNSYDFSDIETKIKFKNPEVYDMNYGLLILCITIAGDIMIFYHKKTDIYTLLVMLKNFDCYDAIVLCNTPDANIIWKENGHNIFNKSDFIGNPNKNVYNVITFSG